MDNRGQVQDGNNRLNQPVDAQESIVMASEKMPPMSQNRALELGRASVGQPSGFYKRSERLAQVALGQVEAISGEMGDPEAKFARNGAEVVSDGAESTREAEELRRGEAELARDEAELVNPEQFAGRQSEVQIEDGFTAEQENAHPELGFVRKIEKRSQEQIATNTMAVADSIVVQKEYRPIDLIKLRDEMSARMRQSYPVPEGMGDVA